MIVSITRLNDHWSIWWIWGHESIENRSLQQDIRSVALTCLLFHYMFHLMLLFFLHICSWEQICVGWKNVNRLPSISFSLQNYIVSLNIYWKKTERQYKRAKQIFEVIKYYHSSKDIDSCWEKTHNK